MMNKEQCEAWTRLVDLSTSSRWFDGVILAADAELTELRQQRDELLAMVKCRYRNDSKSLDFTSVEQSAVPEQVEPHGSGKVVN